MVYKMVSLTAVSTDVKTVAEKAFEMESMSAARKDSSMAVNLARKEEIYSVA